MAKERQSIRGLIRSEAWWVLPCVIALAGSVYLAFFRPPLTGPEGIILAGGVALDPIVLMDMHGQPQQLHVQSTATRHIIYFFSPFCTWCQRNESNVAALRSCTKRRAKFIGISLGRRGLEEYFGWRGPSYPVFVDRHDITGVTATPTTIIVSEEGIIERVWEGAYAGPVGEQIAEALGCTFPGLS